MSLDQSPMRALAFTQLQESFGDLLSVRASVTDHERLIVEYVYEQLFFFDSDPKKEWDRRVRAAFHFLDHASLENPKGVAEKFLNCGELLGMSMNAAIDSKKEAREISGRDAESVIRRKLAYYKDLIEGPYRVLLAPIAYAFARLYRNPDQDFVPGSDGKAKLKVIPKIQRLSIYPQNQLALGVNTHVRNAYAHSNYRILDWQQVELWDPAPQRKGKPPQMWGPDIWHVDKLDLLADNLELTNLAFLLALAIYAINNRTLINARGWAKSITRPNLTEKELRISIERLATDLGFKSKSFAIDDHDVRLEFGTGYPGITQNEELIVGGEGWGRRLIQKVEYLDIPVIEQLLGLFQQTSTYWEGYSKIHTVVIDPEGKRLGEVLIDSSILAKLEGPLKAPVSEVRKLLSIDTIGDAKMNVRLPHTPVDA